MNGEDTDRVRRDDERGRMMSGEGWEWRGGGGGEAVTWGRMVKMNNSSIRKKTKLYVHIHNDLEINDFICTIVYSLIS